MWYKYLAQVKPVKKKTIIMKLKRLIVAFLILFPWWITSCTSSSPTVTIYGIKFPFDVSKRNSAVTQEFMISEYRSYYFAVTFDYFGHDDMDRVMALVGDGIQYPNGTYANPGVSRSQFT